jgi:hypothetical protein
MELPPVGDYLAAASDKAQNRKQWLLYHFETLYSINKKLYGNEMSTLILAVAIFHRFAAANTAQLDDIFAESNLICYVLACYIIASKLDADARRDTFIAEDAVREAKNGCTEQRFVQIEIQILRELDLDLDRPSAATFAQYFVGDSVIDEQWQLLLWYCCIQQYNVYTAFRGSQMSVAVLEQLFGHNASPCVTATRAVVPELFADVPHIAITLGEALRIAALQNVEAVKLMLRCCKQNFNIDYKDARGETALYFAARAGNAEMVKLLVEEGGANVEISDQKNRTPLMIAKAKGNDEIVKLLQQYVKPPLVV